MDPLHELHCLATEAGIQTAYRDITGRLRVARPDALFTVLRALGVPVDGLERVAEARRALAADRPAVEPVVVAWNGRVRPLRLPRQSAARVRIELEDGDERSLENEIAPGPRGGLLHLRERVPAGVHGLRIESPDGSWSTRIISAPAHAPQADARTWGVFFPMHAFGSSDGPATYKDLAGAACTLHGLGASWVATLPMLAAFLESPCEPSPYAPASRLFWNELFISVETDAAGSERARFLDYRAEAARRRPVLQAGADAFFEAGGENQGRFRAFLEDRPEAVDYARFRAACDRFATGFEGWPAGPRGGTLGTDDVAPADVRRHLHAAFRAECEMGALARDARAGRAASLVVDVPLGVHAQGYDVWRWRSLFASRMSAGAPPDELFRGGQDWGFPPFLPSALRRTGYAHLRDVLRHHMRHAGVLRIDHVMSLVRLFWIPEGFPATEGVYVRQHRDEILALLTLEAARTETRLVGEDLGTVPSEARSSMRTHGLLGMFVLQFLMGGPALPAVPERVVASMNTHDTPTFAGFWRGADIEDQLALGLIDGSRALRARRDRAALRARIAGRLGIADPEDAAAILRRLLAWLAASPAEQVLVQLEDLWLEPEPQNVPGTGTERPNWRRRARFGIRQALEEPAVVQVLQRIGQLRETGGRE